MGESTNDRLPSRPPLLPDRHGRDFFVCDVLDAVPKADIGSMEHPIFSLSTRPDLRPRSYSHQGVEIVVKPSADGLATVHDRDVLIYCISQVISALNQGLEVSQTVRFKARELLLATNRNTAGTGYDQLKAALERLAGTRISTNIKTGGKEVFRTFGLIESAEIVRETRDGRMQEVEVKLSDWVWGAIRHKEVLTLHRDYFRLRKPLERRMYDLARKHCGGKREWRIGLALLQKKCGSNSSEREFRRLVGRIAREDEVHGHFPDYAVAFLEEDDQVLFTSRSEILAPAPVELRPLDPEIYETARALAPGWDMHRLEAEWRDWIKEPPRNPEAAFLGFCRTWFERRGRP
ncbi:MAG: replication initiator protein A [Pseudomonadota bacterium]